MRALGHFLLWAGFLAAAFASVCRLEQADNPWATIPWFGYMASIVVGIVGVVLLRKAQDVDHADEEKTVAEYSVLQNSLAHLSTTVEALCGVRDSPSEVLRRIDEDCVETFSDFADSRQSLVKRFGLAVYADVMTEFASAERYVNRAWSAAADGYVDEIATSLSRANQHLKNTGDLLAAAEREA
jgi:hypothetical protein